MTLKFDLLGDPIPENHGKPGANGHVATSEKVNKVRLLLASGLENKKIADELGISLPTLRKHYFPRGAKEIRKARAQALSDLMAKNLLRLDKAADKGNVTAIRELSSVLRDEMLKDRVLDVQDGGDADEQPKSKPTPRGKKEQQVDAAQSALDANPLLDPNRLN